MVTAKRDKAGALKLLKRIMKKYGAAKTLYRALRIHIRARRDDGRKP